jgi:hypothetical protein
VTGTIHVAANCIVNTSQVKCPFPCRIANKDYLSVEDLQLFLEGEQGVRLLHSNYTEVAWLLQDRTAHRTTESGVLQFSYYIYKSP